MSVWANPVEFLGAKIIFEILLCHLQILNSHFWNLKPGLTIFRKSKNLHPHVGTHLHLHVGTCTHTPTCRHLPTCMHLPTPTPTPQSLHDTSPPGAYNDR